MSTLLASRTFTGRCNQMGAVRCWVRGELNDCPRRDDVVQCVSEVAANAVEHTASGQGEFGVAIIRLDQEGVRIEVTDAGGVDTPRVLADGRADGTRGRGLLLLAALTDRWGAEQRSPGGVVWFEVT